MKEKRFYLVNTDICDENPRDFTDEEFVTEAEKQGTIYTEETFVDALIGMMYPHIHNI